MSSLDKCLFFISFAHFSDWVVCHLLFCHIELHDLILCFGAVPFVGCIICNFFVPFCGLSLVSLCVKAFEFNSVQIFKKIFIALGGGSKKLFL